MTEYFNNIYRMMDTGPNILTILSNVLMGCVLFLSTRIPTKFIYRELKKSRKNPINKFDKILILLAGIVFSIAFCIVGSEAIAALSSNKIPHQYVSILVIFSSVTILVRTLVHVDLIKEEQVPSHIKISRLSVVSFIIAAMYNVLYDENPDPGMAAVFSWIALIYYFIEAYTERSILEKCFTISKTKEYSVGAKLVDLINRKFIIILGLGMTAVLLINQRSRVPNDIVLYCNIVDMFSVWATSFVLQVMSSSFVNKFIKQLDGLEDGKSSKKTAKMRRKNLVWICDVIVVVCYFSVIMFILWLSGFNISKYLFHDSILTVGLTIFGTILLYNAFREFTDAFVDKADPIDHEKILTFMPIISVIFNMALFCVSGLIILSQLGFAVMPLLAYFTAAAAAGSFAAQDILKGFLQGIILLFEKNFYIGDFVSINGMSGTVVNISTRTLTLLSISGDEYIIPYNTVNVITNHSRDYYIHNEKLLISPHSDVQKACDILCDVVAQLRKDPAFSDKIYENVVVSGIYTYRHIGLEIGWTLKTAPSAAGRSVNLEVYKRLFPRLLEAGIKIPYQQECYQHLLPAEQA